MFCTGSFDLRDKVILEQLHPEGLSEIVCSFSGVPYGSCKMSAKVPEGRDAGFGWPVLREPQRFLTQQDCKRSSAFGF